MKAEVESRQLAIGKNPNDLLAMKERDAAQDRIGVLERLVADLLAKQASAESEAKDARIAELEAKLAEKPFVPTLHTKK